MRITARVLAVIAILTSVAMTAPVARAQAAYRYWTYWVVADGQWGFSQAGPATRLPHDGDVEAWSFGISDAAGSIDLMPGIDAGTAFGEICGGATAPTDHKRIALVLSPGSSADAPAGQEPGPVRTACVVVTSEATSAQVLSQAASIRSENGLVCAIDGYPATGCADVVEVSDTPPPASAAATSTSDQSEQAPSLSGLPSFIAAGVAAVIVIVLLVRRRR